jgi:ABC-type glycerol-3-phosphate transport system permease component
MSLSARIVRWVVLSVFTAISLIPLLRLVLSSFKTNLDCSPAPSDCRRAGH